MIIVANDAASWSSWTPASVKGALTSRVGRRVLEQQSAVLKHRTKDRPPGLFDATQGRQYPAIRTCQRQAGKPKSAGAGIQNLPFGYSRDIILVLTEAQSGYRSCAASTARHVGRTRQHGQAGCRLHGPHPATRLTELQAHADGRYRVRVNPIEFHHVLTSAWQSGANQFARALSSLSVCP